MDTSKEIFETLYRVRLPYLQSMSLDEIRTTGIRLTGIPDYDNNINSQTLTTYITINTMVEYYKQGVTVSVINPKDTERIYEAISHHLSAWKIQLTNGLNNENAPIDDLILLDEFANTVYEHARYQFTNEIVDSLLGKEFKKIQPINSSNFFNSSFNKLMQAKKNTGTVTLNAKSTPDRVSEKDFFRNRIAMLRGRNYGS